MQDLGYETNSLIRNVGSIFIFVCIFFVKVLIWYPLAKICCRCKCKALKKCRQYPKNLYRELFYNMIITIILESYITITISSAINLRFPSNETWGEVIGASLGAILSILNAFVIPIFLVYMFCHSKEQLLTL
jgi:hypothetical protein